MADNALSGAQTIIIKKVKKGGHGGGHGGGVWKIAYADFVTAMMAFFLLLWLLNSVTQEQLQGISNFFAPVTTSKSQTGSGQVLGGKTIGEPGAGESPTSRAAVTQDLPPPKVGTGPSEGEGDADADGKKAKEDEQFKEAEEALRKSIEGVPAFRQLANSLLVDNTPEGLRIQIVDQQGLAMFPPGSAEPYLHTRRLLEVVSHVILEMTQKISVAGHTDSTGYSDETKYSNWELSSDRANAARRALVQFGVPQSRVGLVIGKAYVDPLKVENPTDPSNRRLTIVLLRGTGTGEGKVAAPKPTAEPRRIREALPGLDALRERQLEGEKAPPLPVVSPPAAPVPAPKAAPTTKAAPKAAPVAPPPTLPGLDALRERQLEGEKAPPPPPAAPAPAPKAAPTTKAAPVAPSSTLPGLDAIRERQRREESQKGVK
ncbi:MAG: flagellar motor protein MotB [Pseudomonadota bacterium]|mgnify:CR=1 FL=1